MFRIRDDFKGANVKVLSVEEDKVFLDVDIRDTSIDWFFWCFKVENAGGKTLTFEFPSKNRVGYYGAAVSTDMRSWYWQYSDPGHNGNSLCYSFKEDENSVYFAHDMVYVPERFYEFAEIKGFEIKPLCKSRKGRDVPYIDTEKGEEAILLVARQHACESTGSYVLEGVLDSIIAELSDKFRIICVPFVDMDGVVDADQGKNRIPHDHNRDYDEKSPSVYPEVEKIREFADTLKVRFAFDFHSPFHLGRGNDTVFFTKKNPPTLKEIERFSALFEEENSPLSLPHYAINDTLPEANWNRSEVHSFAVYLGDRGAELVFAMETPYFLATDTAFTQERGVNTGKAFCRALLKYLDT